MSELPERPDLDQLRRQARELLRAATGGEPQARARIGAVSERATLSAAQLAVAREYGFPSWPALRAEAARRRLMSEAAAKPPGRPGHPHASAAGDRWTLGGATAIETAAGTLSPSALIIGPDDAVLDVSLLRTAETQRRLSDPGRMRAPGIRFVAALFGRHPAHSPMPRFDDVLVTDDQGRRYTLRFESGSILHARPGQDPRPMPWRLRLDPVPARECRWLELRTQGGSAARLLPAARPAVRVGELAPAAESLAERERGDLAVTGMPGAGQRADGQQQHLDIAAGLPPVDGTAVQFDSLISEPDTWCIYLRARPGWWIYSDDRHRKWAAMSVDAEDNLGGLYQSDFGGSTGHGDWEELILRFRPRLDPLARSLTVTFTGARDQVAVEIRLAPAAGPGSQ